MAWFLFGVALCALEAVFPTAFVALMMGISAVIVSLIEPWLAPPWPPLVWMGLSFLGIVASRAWVRHRPQVDWDDRNAETLTDILPGQRGRVLYEGTSWLAQADDPQLHISAHTSVQILRRQGTLLIVTPSPPP